MIAYAGGELEYGDYYSTVGGEYKFVQPLWKSVWRFLRKLGINLPQNLLLGIYSKDVQSYYNDIFSAMFIAALFVIAKTQKQPRCPSTKEWIRKCGTFSQWSTNQH